MIYYLNQLRNSIWLRIVLAVILSNTFAMSAFYITYVALELSTELVIYISVTTLILSGAIFGKFITESLMRPTGYMARAMMTATGQKDIDRPQTNELAKPSKDFIAELSKKVMDLGDGSARNVTATDSEQVQFQFITNNIDVPIITINTDGVVTYANNAATGYLKLPQEKIVGQQFNDTANLSFFSESTLESWLKYCRDNAVIENSTWERVRLNFDDNKRRQFDLSAHYSKNDTTGVELILAFFDRTELYERDDHDLSFVSLAVHELRTPLTIMRGYMEIFEDELGEKLDNEQKEFLHNMFASTQRLSSFISTILNVARAEENALYLNLKKESWDKVVVQACKDMQIRAKAHDKTITVEVANDLPAVGVDKVSIFEVFNNLLDNSIKYTHTKENIEVKAYMKDGMIETTITDHGVGVPNNLMAHIFDKFYRAHQSKNSVSGTGLGLFLCKAIVKAHGGQIWVKSIEGKGSTFGFTLPTYESIADQIDDNDKNQGIVRGAHGWIKNHSLYRG